MWKFIWLSLIEFDHLLQCRGFCNAEIFYRMTLRLVSSNSPTFLLSHGKLSKILLFASFKLNVLPSRYVRLILWKFTIFITIEMTSNLSWNIVHSIRTCERKISLMWCFWIDLYLQFHGALDLDIDYFQCLCFVSFVTGSAVVYFM